MAGAALRGVVATSAPSAWAVGYTGSGSGPTKTLILRWNGITWKRPANGSKIVKEPYQEPITSTPPP